MLKTAVNIRVLASGMNKLGAVSQNAKDLGNVANNISKLGGKNIDKAIENMPRISKALNEMMSTLSKAPVVSENLIQMTLLIPLWKQCQYQAAICRNTTACKQLP